jgi:hypothetical protein
MTNQKKVAAVAKNIEGCPKIAACETARNKRQIARGAWTNRQSPRRSLP